MQKKLGMKVYEAMNRNPIIASPHDSLPYCARKMLANNVGCLIIKERDELVGIATEKDFVEKAVSKELDIKKTKIKDIMTSGMMITTTSDSDLMDAITIMQREDVRRLPVIKDKKLIGLLTITDILKKKPELLEVLKPFIRKRMQKKKNKRL